MAPRLHYKGARASLLIHIQQVGCGVKNICDSKNIHTFTSLHHRIAFWFGLFHLPGISSLASYIALNIVAINTPLQLEIPNDHPWGKGVCRYGYFWICTLKLFTTFEFQCYN